VLSAVRNHLGRELGLIDQGRDEFLWVTDFPLFEWDDDGKRWTFSHHPFTGVRPGDEELVESDPGRALSQAYDLVWNGWELGSGSIRIHDPELQQRVFAAMGIGKEEAQERFGFLLEVLRMGAPPHGGFAMGLERFVALLAGEQNIREVVAFPKTASGSEPLSGARRRSRRRSSPSSEFRCCRKRPDGTRASRHTFGRNEVESGGESGMASEGPERASEAPSLTPLPRVDDLPSAADGYDPRQRP
jgi:aspartyl-tRNA synthetase